MSGRVSIEQEELRGISRTVAEIHWLLLILVLLYLVFGGASLGASGSFALSSIDGDNGFTFAGDSTGDRAGESGGRAGDVNGDGFPDYIVGAWAEDFAETMSAVQITPGQFGVLSLIGAVESCVPRRTEVSARRTSFTTGRGCCASKL